MNFAKEIHQLNPLRKVSPLGNLKGSELCLFEINIPSYTVINLS